MSIDGLSCYGPAAGLPRSPLLAFNVARVDPFALAEDLGREGVEARAGCHCATLAHRDLGMNPPASCRLSFALYNSRDDVTRAMDAVRRVTDRLRRPGRSRRCGPGVEVTRSTRNKGDPEAQQALMLASGPPMCRPRPTRSAASLPTRARPADQTRVHPHQQHG
ncbi:MAG: aminotransferase class V-fold PLP-dependent enzyme [Kribbellaceae bacterium]